MRRLRKWNKFGGELIQVRNEDWEGERSRKEEARVKGRRKGGVRQVDS